jgi:hypothetical protein
MKSIFRVIVSIYILFPSSLYSQNMYTLEDWPMERYHPSTFFSIIWNIHNPEHIFVAASEGALDKAGAPIPEEELIIRYGGHWQMSDLVDRAIYGQREDWRGGGLRINEDGQYSVFHKSRGLNGQDFGDGTLEPKLAPIVEEVIDRILPNLIAKRRGADCADLFADVLNP